MPPPRRRPGWRWRRGWAPRRPDAGGGSSRSGGPRPGDRRWRSALPSPGAPLRHSDPASGRSAAAPPRGCADRRARGWRNRGPANRPLDSRAARTCSRKASEDSPISGFPASPASLTLMVPTTSPRLEADGLHAVAAIASAARLFAGCIGAVLGPMLRAGALAVKKGPSWASAVPRRAPRCLRPAPRLEALPLRLWSGTPQSDRGAVQIASSPRVGPTPVRPGWWREAALLDRGGGAPRAAPRPRLLAAGIPRWVDPPEGPPPRPPPRARQCRQRCPRRRTRPRAAAEPPPPPAARPAALPARAGDRGV